MSIYQKYDYPVMDHGPRFGATVGSVLPQAAERQALRDCVLPPF